VAAEEAAAAAAAAAAAHRAPTPPDVRAARSAHAATLRRSIDEGLSATLAVLQRSASSRASSSASAFAARSAAAPENASDVAAALDALSLPAGLGPEAQPPPRAAAPAHAPYFASAETIALEDPEVTVARLRRRLAAVDDAYAPTLSPYSAAYAAGAAALAAAEAPPHGAAERLRASAVLRRIDAAEEALAAARPAPLPRAPRQQAAADDSELFLSPDASLAGDAFSADGSSSGAAEKHATAGDDTLSNDATQTLLEQSAEQGVDSEAEEDEHASAPPPPTVAALLHKLRAALIASEAAALALPT
jgi:hypothetical protein